MISGPPASGHRPSNVRGAARVNRIAVVVCDRSGVERGQAWSQATSIFDQAGVVVATVGGDDETATPDADDFGDRRPDIYRPMR